MAGEPRTMGWWRSFFRSSGVDIFEVVQRSIVVAVLDYPNVFRLRRDEIAETLFTCHLAQRGGDGDVLSEKAVDEVVDEMKRGHSDGEKRENKVDGMPSNCSYDVAEALTEEMEVESLIVGEVLRIKEVLCNKDESDSVLFESLRRLELMGLSVEALKATEIGRAVNGLRKHNSKQIRHLVRTLIDGWKVLVDEWVNATAAIADNSPVSVHLPIADEEEGLPSPPLDEGALFITQTTNIQLSEFFDGMDDDGNIRNIEDQEVDLSRNSGVYDAKCAKQDYERRHVENQKPVKPQQPARQLPIAEDKGKTKIQEPVGRQLKQQEAVTMNKESRNDYTDNSYSERPSNLYSERPSKQGYEQTRQFGEFKSCQQELSGIQRKPFSSPLQDKSKYSEEAASDKAKLEVAKRKLHERYQEAENAKKQRTIQVMELHDIPKQPNNFRQPFAKPKNNIRNWANGRR